MTRLPRSQRRGITLLETVLATALLATIVLACGPLLITSRHAAEGTWQLMQPDDVLLVEVAASSFMELEVAERDRVLGRQRSAWKPPDRPDGTFVNIRVIEDADSPDWRWIEFTHGGVTAYRALLVPEDDQEQKPSS